MLLSPPVDGFMTAEQIVVERVTFPSGPYQLEGELAYTDGDSPGMVGRIDNPSYDGAALIAGPHPLLGGNMRNNVVHGLGDGLARRNALSLRFNYRGVGGSEGPAIDIDAHLAEFWRTSHVPDEMELSNDVQAAAGYLTHVASDRMPLVLIGYSFGCVLLPPVLAKHVSAYVLVAPTIGKHDYAAFRSIRKPMLVIVSEDDFATDADGLHQWFEELPAPRKLVQRRLDSHFFRGHEDWLAETIIDFLAHAWRGHT